MSGPKLRYRPIACDAESWFGYLLRLANENAIGGVTILATMLDLTPERLFRAPPASILERLFSSTEEFRGELQAGYRGYFKMRSRVCPECLRTDQTPYMRAAWDSPSVLLCSIHNVILNDRCPSCARPLKYGRPSLASCKCGRALGSWPSRRAPPWVHEMYELMGCSELLHEHRAVFDTLHPKDNACAGALHRLCRLAPSKNGPGRVPRYKYLSSEDMPALERVFGDGKTSLFQRLVALQAAGVRSEDAGVLEGSEVALVWKQIRRDRVQARTLGKSRSPTSANREHVSKRFIMRATKLHPTAIDYLVSSGLLKGAMTNKRLPQFPNAVLVPRGEFQGLLALLSSTMTIKEASEFAQTDTLTIRALGRVGAFRVFRLGRAEHVFRVHTSDLASLIRRLTHVAVRRRKVTGELLEFAVAIALCRKRAPAKLPQLLEDLLSGRLEAQVVRSNAIFLGDVFVSAADLSAWLEVS